MSTDKIYRIKKQLKEKELYALLVFDRNGTDTNMNYFVGVEFEYRLLIIYQDKPCVLYTTPLDYIKAKKNSHIKNIKTFPKLDMFSKEFNSKKIGFDEQNLSVYSYNQLKRKLKAKFVHASDVFERVRSIKTPEEIKLIKKSYKIASGILKSCLKKRFYTEKALSLYLEKKTKEAGCELAFEPMVASAENSASMHAIASGRIKKGFLLVDFGVKYKGYCSDITRTVYMGHPSIKEKTHYKALLNAQELTIKHIRKNMKFSELAKYNIKCLGDLYFPNHALGHGLGLEIHELPKIYEKSKDIVENNIVFTIEPGIYFPNKYGIRIEDGILFKDKPIVLSNIEKNLVIIT